MTDVQKPTKESVRDWLRQRVTEHAPLPSLEEIRRQLGWGLVAGERDAQLKEAVS
jgi:hypothetical protein